MKQTDLGLSLKIKRPRKREFLDEMNSWCRGRIW